MGAVVVDWRPAVHDTSVLFIANLIFPLVQIPVNFTLKLFSLCVCSCVICFFCVAAGVLLFCRSSGSALGSADHFWRWMKFRTQITFGGGWSSNAWSFERRDFQNTRPQELPASPFQQYGGFIGWLILILQPLQTFVELARCERVITTRDDHGAGVPEWTPAGVCILGWSRSRSQYFRFEPVSTLRSMQESIKIFKGPNFCNDACCCQTEWN